MAMSIKVLGYEIDLKKTKKVRIIRQMVLRLCTDVKVLDKEPNEVF